VGEDEDVYHEPGEREKPCRHDEFWIFFCDQISDDEHCRVEDDPVWPKLDSLKPELNCFSEDTDFEIVLDCLPEVCQK